MVSYDNRAEAIIRENNRLKEEKTRLEEREKLIKEEAQKRFGVSSLEELEALKEKTQAEVKETEEALDGLLCELEERLGI